MSDGWAKIHRRILKWEWFGDSDTFKVFMYLILMANHEDRRWKGILIKRGQLVTGRKKLSDDTHISEQSIRTILRKLKSTNEITIKSTNKYSIISVVNYDAYQFQNGQTNQQINQHSNQQLTNNQPTTNHKQELKELKNNKKSRRFTPPTLEEVVQYIKENPEIQNVNAVDFYKGFNDAGWIDTKGNPVKNWKLKLRTWNNFNFGGHSHQTRQVQKTKLFPIKGKVCSKQGCRLIAVYGPVGDYDNYYCGDHMPNEMKERYDW